MQHPLMRLRQKKGNSRDMPCQNPNLAPQGEKYYGGGYASLNK